MFSLVHEIEDKLTDPVTRNKWLVLDTHPDFSGHWIVNGFSNEYFYDFGEIIGSYRALAPSGLKHFLEVAEEKGYKLAFFEDPTQALVEFEHLNRVPEVEVNSTFSNTVNGLLPYQVQAFNMVKDLDYGVLRHDTGTGKTVVASALIKYHQDDFDVCLFVVKKHNKVNTVRKLKKLVDLDAFYIRGLKERRERYYREALASKHPILVMNYEQFKFDFVTRNKKGTLVLTPLGDEIICNHRILCIWDEMPTKLKTRTSELYKSVCKCFYRTDPPQVRADRLRPKSLRSYMLSATPIENSPEDFFNCSRLLDGGRTYGTVSEFNEVYVEEWNYYDETKPETFHNLERMRLKAAHFIHQADKSDPDIAAVFPKAVEEPVYIDWDDKTRKLYDDVGGFLFGLTDTSLFSLISIFQMLCDAPNMIRDSAARREVFEDAMQAWEESPEGKPPNTDGSALATEIEKHFKDRLVNDNHPKLEKLKELLLERHPDEQAVVFTRFNKVLMPYLESALTEWGVSYVRYSGTERQKQIAQDTFQSGEVRVFLSSDSGSDSLDLEAGSIAIDYNLPWKWTTLTQRHNRIHRPTSEHDTVYYYSLIMADSIEDRVLDVIERKKGYHNELFDPAAGDYSASARITKEELLWILTGHQG